MANTLVDEVVKYIQIANPLWGLRSSRLLDLPLIVS
jgi:hypothetical protein